MSQNLVVVRRYLEALGVGDEEAVLACLHPDVVQIEHPNAMKPRGDRRGRTALISDMERGRRLLASQRYLVTSALADGDRVAVQVEWDGILAVPLGPFAAGDAMHVDSAMFFELRDGLVVAQQNYDCLPPFGSA